MFSKRISRIRKKLNRLYWTMFKNYILFNMLLMIIVIVTSIAGTLIINRYIDYKENQVTTHYRAVRIVKSDYKNINASDVLSADGWVEILNEKCKIVYKIGKKKDNIKQYSLNFIINKMDYNYTAKGNEYYYSATAFRPFNNKNKYYYCLVKIPRRNVNMTLFMNRVKNHKKVNGSSIEYVLSNILFPIILLIVTMVFMFFYSYRSAKKIVRPLKKIVEGIEKFKQNDYSVRLNFKAENEFSMIKESFNNMAEKIQKAEMERKKIELQKQQLLVDISHDLKTPITSIQGYSKALYDDVVENEEKKKRYLKIIFEKSQRVTALIEDLHELTKLDSFLYELHKESMDFSEFVREIVAYEYENIENSKFELELDIPEYEIFYDFDKKEMMRVIINILSNALKYNKPGTKIKVAVYKEKEGIILIIADNGVGIPKDIQDSLFEPFTRGDKSRNTTGGTGLGLSIVKKIIEKHGGEISLCSDEEFCTIFKINLFNIQALK